MTEKQKGSAPIKSVNCQVTDAITQANTMNLGLAPAQALGILYQTTAQSIGTSMQNSVSNQQHMYSLGLASLTQNLQSIMSHTAILSSRRSETPNFYDQRNFGQYEFQQPVGAPNHMKTRKDN